ncbi:hypothetical protein V2O64_21235 [Verrucomicrobiaceae bacterium 227]
MPTAYRRIRAAKGGIIGFALRRVNDDKYIAFRSRKSSGSGSWETVVFNNADLLDEVVKEGEAFTLDYIDSRHGSWGWGGFDDVTINPGSSLPLKTSDVQISLNHAANGEISVDFKGLLQVADHLEGPWVDLPEATSPYLLNATDSASVRRFVRAIIK